MDRGTIRNILLAQHQRIRDDIAACRQLSTRFIAGESIAAELDAALAQLRSNFAEHNRTETDLLLPLLLQASHGRGTRGTRMAERMLEEHAAEHAAFWERIGGPRREVAENLPDLSEELEAHMAAEERTFLSQVILRADEIDRPLPRGEGGES
jgi:iron-sulfur cluster repair protein YtfE (RIC family)